MYRSLLHRTLNGMTSRATHPERGKEKLTRLFQSQDAKQELVTRLQILPDYFSKGFVQKFCQSSTYQHYCQNTLEYQPHGEEQVNLAKYFTSPKLLRVISHPEQITCLEVYLHWLINECDSFNIHENNYAVELLNLERPDKWFQPKDVGTKRVFIYHHGPTNSGKSTAAVEDLKTLKSHEKGIYMAPLRLLAWEYQQKLVNCSLITGQQKEFKNSNLVSCTIEAAPLNEDYEVAVIDEIQMIGDGERGWAWTRALLAVRAKRIHLCGDERALNIISKLLELTGDILEQKRYSRLSKLTLIHKKFRLENISPGDCIINFSMNTLINHRNDINNHINSKNEAKKAKAEQEMLQEKLVGQLEENKQQESDQSKEQKRSELKNHTAIIYGKLPPQCRKSQAMCFNTAQLPYLVATNAIGMGLNLNIRKIVFISVERPTSAGNELLEEHEIQQIAGRAGRGKETGYVQCANALILKQVEKALQKVNETYGIQLQNIKDLQSNELLHSADEVHHEEEKVQPYNAFLKRFLREKECQIKAACFYFQTTFIILYKLHLENLFKKEYSTTQILHYLNTHSKIGDLYFFQETKALHYLMNLLQGKILDQQQLFYFYNGLCLSLPNFSTARGIKLKMQNCHKQYIDKFIKFRKVGLPQFIVNLYNENFISYSYMDQIAELQFYFNLIETYVWLWGKFEFAFHEIKLAKEIKKALANKINEVLLDNQFLVAQKASNSFHMKSHMKYPKSKSHKENPYKNSSIVNEPIAKSEAQLAADADVDVEKQSLVANESMGELSYFERKKLKETKEKSESKWIKSLKQMRPSISNESSQIEHHSESQSKLIKNSHKKSKNKNKNINKNVLQQPKTNSQIQKQNSPTRKDFVI